MAAVVAQFAPAVGEGVGEGQAVHEDFAGVATTVTRMDGTTVAAQDGTWWFNLRPSNTEPFLRYNGEARTPETMEAIRDAVRDFAEEQELGWIDVAAAFAESGDPEALLADALHPNEEGAEVWTQAVARTLRAP